LKILMVSAEVYPFSKTGGLGDVLGALPAALARLGHEVRVVTPRYYSVDRGRYGLRHIGEVGVPMGRFGVWGCPVMMGRLPAQGVDVPVYFLDREGLYGRRGIYGDEHGGFGDNDVRFAFLSRAALELCRNLDWRPDVVHVNDWHTAPVPALLNTHYAHDRWLGGVASILTIHNMQYQGGFGPECLGVLGLGEQHLHPRSMGHHGGVNFLKGGLNHATLLTTVSGGYARELQTPEFGYGLDGVARSRAHDLYGIVNGIDLDLWNPETDPTIAARYSRHDLSGKATCKRALQQRFGLPQAARAPLFASVGRLVHQKGMDVALHAIPDIVRRLNAQFILVGSGDPQLAAAYQALARRYPHHIGAYIGYNDTLAHQVEAGADFFLMPSRFEPCGLNQLYSLRYGTLPIVRATGGLDDTVQSYDDSPHGDHGTGFKFHDLTPRAIFDTAGWAAHTYYERPHAMRALIDRAMRQHLSWEDSARMYVEVYRRAIAARRM
jgi:starch synthase